MTNLSGQNLGRYHILEQLGQGGMATVYEAYDTRLERTVAIKVIRKGAFPPEQLERVLKRFEREAKALARLTHPNIVPVIDYGEHESSPYLVMPYLPGGTLKQRLGRPWPWKDALRLLIPIADALAYAHEHNILHRDVKPSNILLTEKGQPMLTDFGIAKILDLEEGQTLTGTGVGIGTPEYMSPEQGLGKQVGPLTDVYSLGVVLYEMLTGRKPYMADTPIAVVLKHISDPLPRPRLLVPDLPEAVEQILFKALAKEPTYRYPSMAKMKAAMERVLAQGMTAAEGKEHEHPQPLHAAAVGTAPIQPSADEAATITRGVKVESNPHISNPPVPQTPSIEPKEAYGHTLRRRQMWIGAGVGLLMLLLTALIGGVLGAKQRRLALRATSTGWAQSSSTAWARFTTGQAQAATAAHVRDSATAQARVAARATSVAPTEAPSPTPMPTQSSGTAWARSTTGQARATTAAHVRATVTAQARVTVRATSIPLSEIPSPTPIPTTSSLLIYEGFEQGWSDWRVSFGTANYKRQKNVVHKGVWALMGKERNPGSLGRAFLDVTKLLQPGHVYEIGGWIKTAGVTGYVVIALDFANRDAVTPADGYIKEIGYVSGSTNWTFYRSAPFMLPSMPADASRLLFLVDFNNGAGTAYFDDLYIKEIYP